MPTPPTKKKSSLGFWMQRVVEECDRASVAFEPDPVHDLRVALRRCCSIADGIRAIDPDPAWKEMKKAGKRLFRKLGELRDVHVMQDWLHQLDRPGDPATGALLQFVASGEMRHQQEAMQALQEFDRKQWQRWNRSLPRRMARLRQGSPVFRHLAHEAWTEAYRLHRQSLRNSSAAGWHRLRIRVKRFRYIVENFLPLQHEAWSDDLKQVQDLLGEVHDLDVLWSVASRAPVFPDAESRTRWQQRIEAERARRIEEYKNKTAGQDSLWQAWRKELPNRKETGAAASLRLKLWASFLDPDFKHSIHVSRLALQLYDGLAPNGKLSSGQQRERALLGMAALLHDVGRSKNDKGHHKASYKMIQRLPPPLGWRRPDLLAAGIVARYHRGALPHAGQKPLAGLSVAQRRDISRLAAVLRLASAFDTSHDGRIGRLQVKRENGFLLIAAQGYSPRDPTAEAIAGARHLLETVYRCPVMVKPLRAGKTRAARRKPARAIGKNIQPASRRQRGSSR